MVHTASSTSTASSKGATSISPTIRSFWRWDYRIQINEWAYFQPFVQYFIQPNGTGAVQNATILGFTYAVAF